MQRVTALLSVLVLALAVCSSAFVTPAAPSSRQASRRSGSAPADDAAGAAPAAAMAKPLARALAGPALLLMGLLAPSAPMVEPAVAISGGGKDFAEAQIAGQDFSAKDYSKKDFSGAIAQKTNFQKSKFVGSRFYKANLKEADFTGADLTGASLEGAALDGATFTNAVLQNAYATETLAKVGDISGADFSDMLLDRFLQSQLCKKAGGTNPKTGVDTRESLMCE